MIPPRIHQLEEYLKRLRMPGAKANYKELAREAEANRLTYEEYLALVLEQELVQREQNQLQKRIQAARFPVNKTLDAFEFNAAPSLNKNLVLKLARCEFIANKQNVFLMGNCGTGKTHLAIALGISACHEGYSVRFYSATGLVADLVAAKETNSLRKLEKQWLKTDLIILDEVGYVPFGPVGSELLFYFMSLRYERGSIAITTNLGFEEWPRIVGEEKIAAAMLDRLTHKVHILEMNGESYRLRQSLKRVSQE